MQFPKLDVAGSIPVSRRRYPERGPRHRPPQALQETLVIYTNGASERLLSDRDSLQEQLFQALDLGLIAEQLGTTAIPLA